MALDYFIQTHFPYVLKDTLDGKIVALNREYCYLGTNLIHTVSPPENTIFLEIDKKLIEKVSVVSYDKGRFWFHFLYQPDCDPKDGAQEFKEYFQRLSVLKLLKNTVFDIIP